VRHSVTLVSDAGLFRNRSMRETDAGVFALGLIDGKYDRVLFEEYHHGFGAAGSLATATIAWSRHSPWGWAAWQLAAVGVLAIDEIGRARETEWVSEQMHKLLDARYNAACYQRSITLFASNYSTDIFDLSLRSRFNDGRFRVCAVIAPDLRPAL